jgi:hypothetical protein
MPIRKQTAVRSNIVRNPVPPYEVVQAQLAEYNAWQDETELVAQILHSWHLLPPANNIAQCHSDFCDLNLVSVDIDAFERAYAKAKSIKEETPVWRSL